MSSRGEETQHCEDDRPRPVRFSIFGQIQQQQQQQQQHLVHQARGRDSFTNDHLHHHVSIKAESGQYVDDDRYHDDEELEEEDGAGGGGGGVDQPLDFSAKKSEPKITAKVAVGPTNGHDHHHHHHHPHHQIHQFSTQSWAMPAASHSSESGVSDLCSNSPQSDNEPPMPAKSPLGGSPVAQQPRDIQTVVRMPQVPSPLPAALSAIYGPLAALQNSRAAVANGIDPAITAATTQLLSNLAAVTNGGKGGKNTRPFKAYPRDPMSLPLGLYGLPMAGNNAGEETVMTQASNDAYAEFRRQMLSQVNATKSKRKSVNENGSSRPSSVAGDSDDNTVHGHVNGNDSDVQEATHIRGTVSVTDLRLVNDDDSEHSANDSIHVAGMKSPANVGDLSGLGSSPGMMGVSTVGGPTTSNGGNSSNGSAGKKRGRNGDEIKDEAYWERRRKNNEAAKRSRDARRAKEDEIAIRAAFLEQENLKLRFELANLKNETAKLRCMIYNS